MKSRWEEFYDSVKDRRYGMIFFATLLLSLGVFVVGAIIYSIARPDKFQEFVLPALPGVGICLVAVSWWLIRRLWKRQQEELKYAALSRDELAKARSKLRNNKKTMRRAAPRAPDIDLKY